jgi:ketosteroid isomerase-like protein
MTEGGTMSTESLRQELQELYERWFAALGEKDQAFFERTLSDDWHYTDVRGKNRGKQEYLEYIAPIRSDSPVNRVVDLVVRPFGSLVLVHGDYVVGEAFAPPEGSTTRFTALWQREDGKWRALAHHATVVRDEP